MKRIFPALLLTLSLGYSASAQIENIQYNQLTQKDGLLRSTITCIFKDSKGFMWFGSRSGLSRYDGYNFVHYINDANDSTSISDNFIVGIYEDKSGVLWVSSHNSLNKFNREKETFRRFSYQYLLDPEEENYLANVVPGRKNKLWLSTWSSRLIQFDLEEEKFSRFQVKTNEADGSFNGSVADIIEDEDGILWIGTWGEGLYKYDLSDHNKFLAHYSDSPDAVHRISNNLISSLFKDSSGDIWINTMNGLNRISTTEDAGRSEAITQFYHEPENPYSISHNASSSTAEDHSGILWIRTINGVNTYNRETGQFNAWEHEINIINSDETYLSMRSLLIDNEGIIWFGLQNQGVSNFIIRHNKFNLIQHNPDQANSLNNNFITSIYQDTSGVLWIGTEEGLNRSLPGKNPGDPPAWHLYTHDPSNPSSIGGNRIRTIYRDRKGVLWIGTVHGGLNKYIDSGDAFGQFKHYDYDTSDTEYYNSVDIILEDKTGNLWLGTPLGLYIFDRETEVFYPYRPDANKPDSLISVPINTMAEDRNGAIWFGTWNDGIFKVSPPFLIKDSFVTGTQNISFRENENIPTGPGTWNIRSMLAPSIHQDQLLWIGTLGEGLYGLKEVKNNSGIYDIQVTNYSVLDGLANDDIFGIEEDQHGDLWISTGDGLSRLNPETELYINYSVEDGLNTNLFAWMSHYKSPSGELFYENNGLLSFFPDSIYKNQRPPPLFITQIKVNNEPLAPGEESPLKITASEVREIILSHKQNYLSFEFAALNYIESEANRYKYKLEGLEADWIDAGTRRIATYQGLSPGTYTFKVIASNNDGIWNMQGAELKIMIRPPWWISLPALISYIIILIVLLYGYIKVREKKLVQDKEILEKKILDRTEDLHEANYQLKEHHEELEQQKEELQQTVDNLKEAQTQLVQSEKMASIGQLTAGIAHEINNPVNYINAGIDSLKTNVKEIGYILDLYRSITKENFDEQFDLIRTEEAKIDIDETRSEIRQLLQSVSNGAERTTEIVKGLRTFSRLDENEIKAANLHEGLDLTLVMLHNKYKLHVEIVKDYGVLPMVECFPGKLNQVFMNILSNAIEAIAEKGTITLKTWEDKPNKQVVISIKDDGAGMSESTRSDLFNPFFTTKEVGKGTGLGLSISHGIIEQHKGSIKVKSKLGEGSEFIISIPVKQG